MLKFIDTTEEKERLQKETEDLTKAEDEVVRYMRACYDLGRYPSSGPSEKEPTPCPAAPSWVRSPRSYLNVYEKEDLRTRIQKKKWEIEEMEEELQRLLRKRSEA